MQAPSGTGPRERPGIAGGGIATGMGAPPNLFSHPAMECPRCLPCWVSFSLGLVWSFVPILPVWARIVHSVPSCIRNKYLGEVFCFVVCLVFILERVKAKGSESEEG